MAGSGRPYIWFWPTLHICPLPFAHHHAAQCSCVAHGHQPSRLCLSCPTRCAQSLCDLTNQHAVQCGPRAFTLTPLSVMPNKVRTISVWPHSLTSMQRSVVVWPTGIHPHAFVCHAQQGAHNLCVTCECTNNKRKMCVEGGHVCGCWYLRCRGKMCDLQVHERWN